MRWTGKDPDVRDVAEGEVWVGVMDSPLPHVAIVMRKGEGVDVHRFRPEAAREMGEELIRVADRLSADNN